MKTYHITQALGQDEAKKGAANEHGTVKPEDNPFAKAASEWNNALLIAAEKMWR